MVYIYKNHIFHIQSVFVLTSETPLSVKKLSTMCLKIKVPTKAVK